MKVWSKLLLFLGLGMFLIGAKPQDPAAPGLRFESFDLDYIEEFLKDMGFEYTTDIPFDVPEIYSEKGYDFRGYVSPWGYEDLPAAYLDMMVYSDGMVQAIQFPQPTPRSLRTYKPLPTMKDRPYKRP